MENVQILKSAAKPGRMAVIILIITIVYSTLSGLLLALWPIWKYDYYVENIVLISNVKAFLFYALTLLFIVYLLIWFARIYRFYLLTGAIPGSKPTTTLAVLYWFIPIVNLFKPCELLIQVFNNIDVQLLFKGVRQKRVFSDAKLIIWWILFLYRYVFSYGVSYCFGQLFALRLLEDQKVQMIVSSVYSIFSLAAIILFLIFTVWMISSYVKAEKKLFEQSDILSNQSFNN